MFPVVDVNADSFRYADQAKRIVNVAVVNEDKNTKLIDALKFEVEELRRQLAEKEGMLGIGPAKPLTVVERVEVTVNNGILVTFSSHVFVGADLQG